MKKLISIILSIILAISFASCTKANAAWQEQYDLGLRYLSELEYESAIQAFTSAIEIDPKQARPYIGLADVYIAQGNFSQANEILNKAESAVSDKSTVSAIISQLPEDISSSNSDNVVVTNPDGSTKYKIYYDNGVIRSVTVYNNDDNSSTTTYYNEDGSVERITNAFFDEKGREVKHISYVNGNYTEDGMYIETYIFTIEYLYTEGSPVVTIKCTIEQSGKTGTDELTYTMSAAENEVYEFGYSWDDSDPINLDINMICENIRSNGTSLFSYYEDGELIDSY